MPGRRCGHERYQRGSQAGDRERQSAPCPPAIAPHGNGSAVAVRRHVRCFAAEWKIPAGEIAPLMKGRFPHFDRICEFCDKHDASIDWIIGGDLKYLQQMKRNVQAAAALNNPGGLNTRIMDIGRSILALPLEKREFALVVVQQLVVAARSRNVKRQKRKVAPKAVDGEIAQKRALAYLRMEPNLRDCEKLARLAGQLSLDHDRDLYDFVVHQAAEKMEKLWRTTTPWTSRYEARHVRAHPAAGSGRPFRQRRLPGRGS
jgi:hypothetical protein